MGYVYLIGERDNPSKFKIGMTNKSNVDFRKLELQTGNPNELYVHSTFKSKYPYKLERLMHQFYYSKKILNEWFELNDEEVSQFLPKCQLYENNLKCVLEPNYFDDF